MNADKDFFVLQEMAHRNEDLQYIERRRLPARYESGADSLLYVWIKITRLA